MSFHLVASHTETENDDAITDGGLENGSRLGWSNRSFLAELAAVLCPSFSLKARVQIHSYSSQVVLSPPSFSFSALCPSRCLFPHPFFIAVCGVLLR